MPVSEKSSGKDLVITRLLNAPLARVFQSWTDPARLALWWGPKGFTNPRCEADARPGGALHIDMRGPDGTIYPMTGTYEEVVENKKIIFRSAALDPKGKPLFEVLNTVTFAEENGKTKLTLRAVVSNVQPGAAPYLAGMDQGWNESLDRLELFAPEFVISRTLDAPRNLVWKVFTETEHMKQWWGPKGFRVEISKMDFRPGGIYHYCLISPEGHEMWGRFVYKEIIPPSRIVFINSFSDEKGGLTRHPYSKDPWPLEMLSTFTFEEENGKTKFTVRWIPYNASPEEKKVFESGHGSMKQGWTGTLDQLTDYLKKTA